MKRIISILLSACLIISLMPVTAYADVDMAGNELNMTEITAGSIEEEEEPLMDAATFSTPSEAEYDEEGVLPDGEIGDDMALATPSELEELTEEDLAKIRTFSYTDSRNGVTVCLEYSCNTFGVEELPKVVVVPLETEALEAFKEEVEEKEETAVKAVVAYDITFLNSDGEELEPVEGESVHVEFRNAFPEGESEISIYHIDDGGAIENVDGDSRNGSVSFEAEEFSVFGAVSGTATDGEVAYAVFDGVDTLTLSYGNTSSGGIIPVNGFESENGVPWVEYIASIKKVIIDDSFKAFRPKSTTYLFNGMGSLTQIVKMENLNTSEVENMSNMFKECHNLTELDLSNFDTKKVTYMTGMFTNDTKLQRIYVDPGKFVTSNLVNGGSDKMFGFCLALKGGNGTDFNSNFSDATYARVDIVGAPGYFSMKNKAYTYTVTLDQNGGSGGTESVTATYGLDLGQITLPTRTCYDFDGYYDGTGNAAKMYYDKDGESQGPWDKAEASVLYAHWSASGHDWSGKDGICKRKGCGFVCDHNGIKSGICPICGKNLGSGGGSSDSDHDYYKQGTFDGGTDGAVTGIWLYDISRGTWSFATTGGQKVTNSWVKAINPYATGSQPKASWFYFDANGNMLTGWQWIKDSDGVVRCYYLNPVSGGLLGACWLDGRTPDGYMVDKDGAWTENGKVQTR